MTDYYPILMRAVGALEPNTDAARAELFGRARTMLFNQISTDKRWTRAAVEDEIKNFDRTVERIESEFAYLDARAPPRPAPDRERREILRCLGERTGGPHFVQSDRGTDG